MDKLLRLYTYVDGVNDTLFLNSDNPIEIGEFRYDAKRMGGAPIITASVYYPSCLDDVWTDNVYAKFNGEKYYLKQTPTSSYNNESTMYKHDLELVSERVILDNVYFFDAVVGNPQGDDKPVSNSTKVVFFGNVHEFVKRLNSSLEYAKLLKWEDGVDGNGNAIKIPNGYHVVVDDDNNITKEEKLMSFEDQFFSNVLQEIYNTYEVPYYFEGKTIHIGYSNKNEAVPTFSYGVDNALLSITKNNANYKIVNRATATGSSDNIPFYYPNNSPKGYIEAATNREELGATIANAEAFANQIEIDGEVKYEAFSISNIEVTSEEGSYSSGDELYLNKIVGNATRQFDISFTANNAGVFNLNLDCTISNVRKPLEGASVVGNVITHRFSVDLIKVRGEKERIVSSTDSGNIEIPISMSGAYVVRITLELASKYTSTILTCNYALSYSYDEGFTGWLYKGREVSLDEIGLAVSGYPISGDTITQRLVKYVKTSQNLMPSIYRETDGEERFYNATNEIYPFKFVDGYELKDKEYVGEDGMVHHQDYHEYNNPYVEGRPKEHIFTVDDIKPTIKETEVNGLRIDMFSEFAYDLDDNDETVENEEGSEREYVHSYFFAKLRKLDFNLFDHAIENQPMTISFTSGDCGACNFEIGVTEEFPQKNPVQVNADGTLKRDANGRVICGQFEDINEDECQPQQQDTINHEVWIALKKEDTTYGILMPKAPKFNEAGEQIEAGHRPKACTEGQNDGDTFVIIGINLPQSYIINAEKKLEAEIIKYLQDNNDEKFTFSIGFSRIYFEENNILDQLSENSKIRIIYDNKPYDLYVSSFSYSMSEGDALPEIRVELDETLKVSQNALQNAISQVKSELGRALGSIDVVGAATPYFLRKDADDEAQGRINFKKGIKFGEGGKVEIMPDNGAKLTIDYIEVTKKATFNSLEIAEKKHVGGQILLTPAAMKCGEVEEFDDYYRCYFQTKSEGGDEIFNQFAVNDQAICQTFNAWGSRYYWRLVVGVGEDYIDLSKTDCDEYSDIPSVGDSIILLGNRTDITRQSAIVLSAYDDDAPSLIMYNGINSYSLVEKNITGIIWNPETKEPQMYSYGSFFFGDRQLNKNFITFQKKDGDTDKNLYINGKLTIGAGSEGLSNLSEWADKESKINEAHSTASAAEKIARNAAESAKRVEILMSEIDDDAILTISEKRTLRTEWETINGVASLSTTGDSGSYMGTKELIDELRYKAGEEVIISYRDAVLTHNGIKIKFNNSGIVAFELAYNNLRECLTSIHLYMDETTYNFDRQLVAKSLTAYYDAQSRILSQAQSGYSDGLAAKVSKLALNAQSSADAANTLALNAKNSAAEAAADAIKAQSTANKAVVDANSAKAAADAAQTTADSSVTKLNEWSSDSVISPFEKQGISDERAFVVADKDDIDNQKAKYIIENEEALYNAYLNAYNAYLADLNTVLSTSDACPVPTDMSAHQGAYYQARTALLSAISAAARNVADLAQDAADKAKDAATAAQTTADNAQKYAEGVNKTLSEVKAVAEALETSKVGSSEYNEAMAKLNELIAAAKKAAADAQFTADKAVVDANSAKAAADAAQTTADGSVTKLNEWSSDSVISPFEKQGISDERAFVMADKDDIDNQKAKYIIENEEALYNAYLSAYNAYLADLNTVLSTSDACPVPTDMSAHQGAYYQARTALLSAISAAARNVADLAQDAADKAKDAATAAQTTADKAKDAASAAQTTADDAKAKAEDAQTRAGLLESTTSNLSTKITDVENNITETVEDINKRLDGVVENYFEEGVPTLSNYPANQWTTDNEKKNHIGDTYTNIQAYIDDETTPDAGKSWRWVYTDSEHSGYHWHPIADSDAVKALQDAAKAQSTADGKSATFLRQPTNYKEGDLWILQSDSDHTAGKKGEILTANTSSTNYNASHWTKEVVYTDDSKVNSFINGEFANYKTQIQSQIDKKAQTWYQSTDPSTQWTTASDKNEHIGDMWLNTSSNTVAGVEAGMTAIWNGSAWKTSAVPQEVFDKIDGKASLFVIKPTIYHENDMWIIGNDISSSDMPSGASVGELMVSTTDSVSYNKSHWVKKVKYTDDKALEEFLEGAYKETMNNLNEQIQSTREAIERMNNDNVLDESEKSYIRTEWEKINGYPYFDKIGSTGSYQTTLDIIAASGYTIGEAVTLTFNGKKLTFNGKSIAFNYRGMDSFRAAYYNLRDFLYEIKLYNVGSTDGFDREKLSRLFSAYYDAQAILIDNSQKYYASKKAEDSASSYKDDMAKKLGYANYNDMKEQVSANGSIIMPNGYLNAQLIEAQAITSDMIAVEELFSQHIEANDMNLKTGCVIGDLSIGKYVSACGKEDLVDSVHSKYTSVEQDVTYTQGTRLSSGGIEVTGEAYGNGQCLLPNEFSVNASRSPKLNKKPIVKIHANIRPALSVTGKSLFSTASFYGDNIVIEIDNGMISGLRPMSKNITENSYNLTEYDHTLFCTNSRTRLYLPEFPLEGQEYVILVPNGGVDVYGNGQKIYLFYDGIDRDSYTCGDLATRTEQRLYWNKADNKWWATYIKY